MKHNRKLVCMSLAILLLLEAEAQAGRSIPITPLNGKQITLRIEGKEKTYYRLRAGEPLTFQVDGPGRLIVLSRLIFQPNGQSSGRYSIRLAEGRSTLKVHTTQTGKSRAVFKDMDAVPGKSRKFSLRVAEGSHTYSLTLENTDLKEAGVRLLLTPKGQARKLVTLEPLSYERIVTAVVKEKLIAYYVATKIRNVHLRVIGPTRLRISTRLNYHSDMMGKQVYSVQIVEGSKRWLSPTLTTTKSVSVQYQEWKEVVPGKVILFSMDVPQGEHIYKFALGQSLAHSVSLKFSIPRKDLANEK